MKKQQQIQPYLSSKHNPIALKICKIAKKQNLTNLTKYFPMPISIYLIGQNFCKKQNTKQIFIMALQKKKSRQKTKKQRIIFQ